MTPGSASVVWVRDGNIVPLTGRFVDGVRKPKG